MLRRPPMSTRTETLSPYRTHFRSPLVTRTTGPIGAAAWRPSLDGAYPPLFSGCELGARTRPRTGTQKRETSPPVVADEIGRAHVCTPVTNAHLVCRLLLEKKKNTGRVS